MTRKYGPPLDLLETVVLLRDTQAHATAERSSGQNTGTLGMCLTVKMKIIITLLNHTDDSEFKNRSFQEPIIEEKDAGVKENELMEDKEPDSGSHDGSEEENSAVKDEDFIYIDIVQLLATNPLTMHAVQSDNRQT